MRRSKTEIYLHVVWATRNREPVLRDGLDLRARELILAEAVALRCETIALNGTLDHLHLLARVPGNVSASQLAKRVKGGSSREINQGLRPFESFAWQEGYGAFSVSRSHIPRVTRYIEEQEQRHLADKLWLEWEEVDTAAD